MKNWRGRIGLVFVLISMSIMGLDNQSKIDRLNIQMVRIPGGTFMMGSNSSNKKLVDERPAHRVTLSSFYMSKTEVTQGQWQILMDTNPSFFQKGDNYPVEQVSWYEVQVFIARLNQMSGKTYRLPSEAEWEYASRGGDNGDRYGDLASIAWYDGNSAGSTKPVAQKQANAYGLYDMLGNVWEWCSDWQGEYRKNPSPTKDPSGPKNGMFRIFRGGSWLAPALFCRASYRFWSTPISRGSDLGFRLVCL